MGRTERNTTYDTSTHARLSSYVFKRSPSYFPASVCILSNTFNTMYHINNAFVLRRRLLSWLSSSHALRLYHDVRSKCEHAVSFLQVNQLYVCHRYQNSPFTKLAEICTYWRTYRLTTWAIHVPDQFMGPIQSQFEANQWARERARRQVTTAVSLQICSQHVTSYDSRRRHHRDHIYDLLRARDRKSIRSPVHFLSPSSNIGM